MSRKHFFSKSRVAKRGEMTNTCQYTCKNPGIYNRGGWWFMYNDRPGGTTPHLQKVQRNYCCGGLGKDTQETVGCATHPEELGGVLWCPMHQFWESLARLTNVFKTIENLRNDNFFPSWTRHLFFRNNHIYNWLLTRHASPLWVTSRSEQRLRDPVWLLRTLPKKKVPTQLRKTTSFFMVFQLFSDETQFLGEVIQVLSYLNHRDGYSHLPLNSLR